MTKEIIILRSLFKTFLIFLQRKIVGKLLTLKPQQENFLLDYIPLEQADIHSPSAFVYVVDERSEEIQADRPISDAEVNAFA